MFLFDSISDLSDNKHVFFFDKFATQVVPDLVSGNIVSF